MSQKRPRPFVWVTWLAQIMSGDNPCLWQAWFKAHNTYQKRISDFDTIGWTIDHNKMLMELTKKLSKEGKRYSISYDLEYPIDGGGAKIKGKADCVVENNNTITIYDCKTGKEKMSDQAQVMLYMYIMSRDPKFEGKEIKGVVAYHNHEIEIPKLPGTFESNLIYFFDSLCKNDPLPKAPGDCCKFCDITKADCTERIEKSSLKIVNLV